MNVKETYEELLKHANGQCISDLFIIQNKDKIELAIFTYEPISAAVYDMLLYKCNQIIKSDGENIDIQNITKQIIIKRKSMTEVYYADNFLDEISSNYINQLQFAINSLKTTGKIKNTKDLRNAFKSIVQLDYNLNIKAAYRKICPKFLRMLHI